MRTMAYRYAWKKKAAAQACYKRKLDFLNQFKDRPCADCGGRFPPCCMDFDHRPGAVKHLRLTSNGNASGMINLTYDEILKEVRKCDVVCANCHRIRTYIERDHDCRAWRHRDEAAQSAQSAEQIDWVYQRKKLH